MTIATVFKCYLYMYTTEKNIVVYGGVRPWATLKVLFRGWLGRAYDSYYRGALDLDAWLSSGSAAGSSSAAGGRAADTRQSR